MTEDEKDELTVLRMLEALQQLGEPMTRPAKVIPWPFKKKPQPKPGQS
jgi:hypothetical protein